MHALVLTLAALGADTGGGLVGPVVDDHQSACACDHCGGGAHGGRARKKDIRRALRAQRYMMPQTCYDPTFGCYQGSRHMHRYPAFHGTFYRRPYNYRNLFDEPVFFSSLKTTAFIVFTSVPLELVLGFAMAYLFNRHFPLKRLAVTISVIPTVLAPIAASNPGSCPALIAPCACPSAMFREPAARSPCQRSASTDATARVRASRVVTIGPRGSSSRNAM